MTTAAHSYDRPILVKAVRTLIGEATAARAALALSAPERDFYLGVEAAAQEIIHPEVTSARAVGWLRRETRDFREGYLRSSAMLSVALVSAEPPLRLRLPDAGGTAGDGSPGPA